jgi:hypothetical protein
VNGLRYRETGSYGMVESGKQSPIQLQGSVVMDLVPGEYSAVLYWKRILGSTRPWHSATSSLDGFAMGRVLAAVGEWEVERVSVYSLKQYEAAPAGQWSDVGDSVLQFTLPKATSVALSYNLPLSQSDNPQFSTWSTDSWERVQVRLVIDGIAYRHLSSFVDGSVRGIKNARATMVLPLAAGGHTARLQWENVDGSKWTSVSFVTDAASSYASVFLTINTWNNEPRIVAPSEFLGFEDEALNIDNIAVRDTQLAMELDYDVTVQLSVQHGWLTLESTPGITFASGNGERDEYLLFSGSLSSVNVFLSTLTYHGFLNWYGIDTLKMKVTDQGSTGFSATAVDEKMIRLSIASVNDPPQLAVPAVQLVQEDEETSIFGVTVLDADVVSRATASSATFEVELHVLAGTLSLPVTDGLHFVEGSGIDDQFLRFSGDLFSCNAALFEIRYKPDKDFNEMLHPDSLGIRVRDINYRDSTVTEVFDAISISVQAVDDVVRILPSNAFTSALRGYAIKASVGVANTDIVHVGFSVMSAQGRLQLSQSMMILPATVTKTPGGNRPVSDMVLSGPVEDITAVANAVIYTRMPAYSGYDVVFITQSYSSNFLVADNSSIILGFGTKESRSLAVSSASPSHGTSDGGTKVVIVGRGFYSSKVSDLWCQFGLNSLVVATVTSDTLLTCVTPANSGGSSSFRRESTFVMVTNGYGVYSNPIPYFYLVDWAVAAISPLSGPKEGLGRVAITGKAFPSEGGITCLFGGAESRGWFVSPSRIECDIPACNGAAGVVSFALAIGGKQSASSLTYTYTGNHCSCVSKCIGCAGKLTISLDRITCSPPNDPDKRIQHWWNSYPIHGGSFLTIIAGNMRLQ